MRLPKYYWIQREEKSELELWSEREYRENPKVFSVQGVSNEILRTILLIEISDTLKRIETKGD